MIFFMAVLLWLGPADTPLELLVPFIFTIGRMTYLDRPIGSTLWGIPLLAAAVIWLFLPSTPEYPLEDAGLVAGKIAVSSYIMLQLLPGFREVAPAMPLIGRGIFVAERSGSLVRVLLLDLGGTAATRLRRESHKSGSRLWLLLQGAVLTGFEGLFAIARDIQGLYGRRRLGEGGGNWLVPPRRRLKALWGDVAMLIVLAMFIAFGPESLVPEFLRRMVALGAGLA